ncbi:type II toxin-antitoxin system VapB family antitoxin [Mitsuaria sp. GD03876]|uniref:type II toxin-antitoxin system VapB family antitoxin n=1 Tax=Mitsuaria sp. GD03876 TaxID=2975399 RepID=UPI002446A9A8|nr:type II toxin-antitoxin system VapB family antitoxin [Mitsuaria sp. GD03876]MDH0863114.1 type II toxin-antitoxin system VapB family antitoxin [Mitsuaria sp. GD03876]
MVNEALYQRALEVADEPMSREQLINTALRWFIARQAQLRLAAMGGIAPHLPDIPRRRQDPADEEALQ